jgi:hypothetical protein
MGALFKNEEVRFGNGFPSLVRFFKGNPAKPLVVFFPGWSHLGRISYGFPGCKEEHFLAHWIVKKGYSFLATSYPIDHPVYSDVHPGFTLSDWGEMASQIVDQFISENRLKKEVIGINWSASGQVIRPFNVACIARGINVCFHLGIEATPAMQVPSDRVYGFKKTDNNMVSLKRSHYDLFWEELEEQSRRNGEEIINNKQYTDYILGDIPIAVTGTNEFFEDGRFTEDIKKGLEDKGFFSFTEYPLVAIISGDSSRSPYHPIVDKYTWGFINTRKIYHDFFVKSRKPGSEISEQKLKELVRYVNGVPNRLSKVISGNHFLFIGKKGTRNVANSLEKFECEVEKIKADISGILS